MPASERPPARYRIRTGGHLDLVWSTWFESLATAQEDDATTMLIGQVVDQAEFFGLLGRLRDGGPRSR